jgi:hypothetical protein
MVLWVNRQHGYTTLRFRGLAAYLSNYIGDWFIIQIGMLILYKLAEEIIVPAD